MLKETGIMVLRKNGELEPLERVNRMHRLKKKWDRRPTWELNNMIKALSMDSWLNTNEDNERLATAKEIVRDRRGRR